MLFNLKERGQIRTDIAIIFIVTMIALALIVLLTVGLCKLFPSIQC